MWKFGRSTTRYVGGNGMALSLLSPNEETALRRIAQGIMLTTDMDPCRLSCLKHLALIEETGTDLELTDLARRRLDGGKNGRGL
jgi:hypothetical protein